MPVLTYSGSASAYSGRTSVEVAVAVAGFAAVPLSIGVAVLKYHLFFDINPFTHLAVMYQEILFFNGPIGHWRWLLALGGASVLLFLGGYWVFDRLRDSFAEVV